MFCYNPTLETDWEENPNGRKWRVVIDKDQKKFVVTYMQSTINKKFIVDEFENKARCKFYKEGKIISIEKEKDIWYSFDPDSGNFHIVPDESIEIKIECADGEEISLYKKLDCIRKRVKETVKTKRTGIGPGEQKTINECVRNHKYISVKTEKNEYLMSFNRLWCDVKTDGNHICNNFGQAQFMCYPIDDKQINCFSRKFKLMYPRSDEDGKYNSEATHLVYNPPYDINDSTEAIAKGFAEFIKRCEDGTFIESCENGEFRKLCEDSKRCEEK